MTRQQQRIFKAKRIIIKRNNKRLDKLEREVCFLMNVRRG